MPDMELYAVPVPQGGRTRDQTTAQQQQVLQALLGSDVGNVEAIASDPDERVITVEYADDLAEVRAAELRELTSSLSQPLPYHATSGTSLKARYVSASSSDVEPVDPRSEKYQRITLRVSDAGTPANSWRALACNPTQVDHPFGNDTSAPVGVPATASKVRWYDDETEATATPTVQTTRAAKGGDVDVLDATAAPYDAPEVIYEIDLGDIGWTDPRVWDDRGVSGPTDADGAVTWMKVWDSSTYTTGSRCSRTGCSG